MDDVRVVAGWRWSVADAEDIAGAWRALGRQLAASRRAAGFSQARLAVLVGYSRSTVANGETGRQRVPCVFWRRCDRVLGGDALCRGYGEVDAAMRAERVRAVAEARYEALAVTPLSAVASAGTGPVPPDGSWSGVPGGSCRDGLVAVGRGMAADDPEVVAYLEGALGQHARIAATFGGGDLVPLIIKHVSFLYAGYGGARGRQRERLLGLCARYGEFLGWLCQDLGRAADARFWSDRALTWARSAGDAQFVSYVLMRHSDLAEERSPAQRVLGMAQAAGRVPGLSQRAMALALQQEALGHARAGNALGFERSLEQARARIAAAGGTDDAPWGLYCTPAYLGMQEATGWLELGKPGRAVMVFERDLAGLPVSDQVEIGRAH